MKMNKKGQVFENLGKLAIGVASIAIVLVVAFLIMAQGKTQIASVDTNIANTNATECPKSVACNATSTMQSAVATIPPWIPLVIITAIGAILIGLISMFRKAGR